ncbi:hypothetical protein BGW36DRAFT_298964 [Talaromyces proteolyticus]|uniref:Transcription factor domain-containing protein n=1 Tax=Talaromyces proteolyticus TaxID=1131652 RepID=A0AAD4KQ37_9EURO|nr:uncharacterized protein BGW36DRAFT_298964 [Talaromyces proteolyticus]KAH8695663.1 hypothetical protein BGW36DRAFT_298964 [Talaromyces proteolyticus]
MSTTDNPQPSADDEAYKLVSRFINIQTPGTTTGSPRWLQAAGLIAETCPLLRDVLEATSRLFLAKTIKDTEIELDAQQRYGSVLSRVQSSLRQPDESSSTWLLLSIAVVTIFEMLQQRSENPIVCHWGALLTLIEKRGPLRHVHGIERCFFIELRLLWVLWSVEFRRPTFLSLEEWRTIPWTQTDVQKDALQHLLDTVLEIPAFLRQCDRYTEMSNDPSIPAQESTLMMRSMQSWAFILRNRLQQWKGDYADDYPAGQPYECNQNDTLPIFQCWNRERDIVITPTAFMYPDLVLATSLCIYKAILLSLSNEVVSADFITQTKKYSYACDICRSIQFYLQANHGNVTMQILYPLRIAYQVFEERSIERQFVEDISEFIVKQYHFEAFPSLVTATTPPDNSVLNQQI